MVILRGEKLHSALRMLAEDQMSDEEVAKRLSVSLRALEVVRDLPFFEQRVEQIRTELKNTANENKRVASEGSIQHHTRSLSSRSYLGG
jgi:hypothetical protein